MAQVQAPQAVVAARLVSWLAAPYGFDPPLARPNAEAARIWRAARGPRNTTRNAIGSKVRPSPLSRRAARLALGAMSPVKEETA